METDDSDDFMQKLAARARQAGEPTEEELRCFDRRRALEDFLPRRGEVFHEFDVGSCLGVGSFGTVHRVYDATGAVWALKYLRPEAYGNSVTVDNFRREMDVLRAFHRAREQGVACPTSLPKYHSHGRTIHGIPFIVMNCVEGESLDTLWRRGELSILYVVNVLLQICEALAFCHERGIVHCDVKPLNILVTKTPEGEVRAALIDFGLASAPESITDVKTASPYGCFGTIGYMPPEQAGLDGRPASARNDIFSLGATLCRCTYRSSVFPLGTEAVLLAHAQKGNVVLPTRRSDDPGIWEIIQKATRPNPEDRYASMEEFSNDLRRVRDACNELPEVPLSSGPAALVTNTELLPDVQPRVLVVMLITALLIGWFFGRSWA